MSDPLPAPGRNSGHGHVYPRPDGVRARCGGPGLCSTCRADEARKCCESPAAVSVQGDELAESERRARVLGRKPGTWLAHLLTEYDRRGASADGLLAEAETMLAQRARDTAEVEQLRWERDMALSRVAAAEAVQARMADSLPDSGPVDSWSERDLAVRDYEGDLSAALAAETDFVPASSGSTEHCEVWRGVWLDTEDDTIIVRHRYGSCYDVIDLDATGAHVGDELASLPRTAVPLVLASDPCSWSADGSHARGSGRDRAECRYCDTPLVASPSLRENS